MKRKQLLRVLGAGSLALSLLVSPMAGVNALAAEEDVTEGNPTENTPAAGDATDKKEGGSVKKINPLQEAKPGVGTEGDDDYQAPVKGYSDTEIPVWGFTQDSTVYSVDVEWGAMTFQYENSTWDPETHTSKTGAGWRVYDSEADKAVVNDDGTAVKEHAINEVKVTNHSNAGVWATLTYAGETAHADTTGDFSFTKGTAAGDTSVLTAKAGTVPAYLTLATADNGKDGAAGTATVGKAYFMPTGIGTDDKTNGINKWTKIGTITVGIKTEQPKAATTPTEPTEPTEP